MKKIFYVSEQDIFNYIFYPEQLSTDKKEFLATHQAEFKEQIDLCKELKQINIIIPEQDQTYSAVNGIVELYPVNFNSAIKNNFLTLAAASSELSIKIETKTFTDEKSQFLVRLVSTLDEKVLYVFSKDKSFKEAKLTLFPSKKIYKIDSLESSIKIDNHEEVEKISIEDFN